MTFADKARYAGPFDDRGVPRLDYRGSIGCQYNPIAVAQYGLAAWNAEGAGVGCQVSGVSEGGRCPEQPLSAAQQPGHPTISNSPWRGRFLAAADWLVENLEPNSHGVSVWMHQFDWEYFQTLRAPWYSGLAQGQGISLLVRAHVATGQARYRDAAERAFQALVTPVDQGGTLFVDERGDWWIEEYITDPPTHILNGMMWAMWGVWDWGRRQKSDDRRQMTEDGDQQSAVSGQP